MRNPGPWTLPRSAAPHAGAARDPGLERGGLLGRQHSRDAVVQARLLLHEHLARLFLHLLQAGFLRLQERQDLRALRIRQLNFASEILDVLRRRRSEHRPTAAPSPPSFSPGPRDACTPWTPGPLAPWTSGPLDAWPPGPPVVQDGALEHNARKQTDGEHEPYKGREPHTRGWGGHCTPPVEVVEVVTVASAVEFRSNDSRSVPPTSPVTRVDDAGIVPVESVA